jgi:hypothetical protein
VIADAVKRLLALRLVAEIEEPPFAAAVELAFARLLVGKLRTLAPPFRPFSAASSSLPSSVSGAVRV